MVYLHIGSIFRSDIYLCFVSLSRYEVYHPQTSPSDKEWAVGWTQPDLLPCEVVSLVIGISQGLLARWQGFTFGISSVLVKVYWLDDEKAPLECHWVWWQEADTSKPLVYKGSG